MLKRKPYRNKKITESARGESCTLHFEGCKNEIDTVVFCHSPFEEDGSGGSQKSDDIFGCYGCFYCHDILDCRRYINGGIMTVDRRDIFHRAMKRTLRRLIDKGILI